MASVDAAASSDRPAEEGVEPKQSSDGRAPAQYTQDTTAQQKEQEAPRKPSTMDNIKAKIKPQIPIFMLMFKGSLAPTIAIAFYQADAVAAQYTTLGYLVAIMSLLGFAIMPRAKFFQTMLLDILGVCIGSAMVLLGLWSAIQARKHTTPPGHPLAGYNSSASAVCGIWLFFNIFLVNTVRSAFPQLNFPTIIYAIFANVAFIYGAIFSTDAQMLSFVRRLIISFLTGFALATAVSLVVFPTNARKPVFMDMMGIMNGYKGLVKAQMTYMKAFDNENPFAPRDLPPPPKKGIFARMFPRRKVDETKKEPRHFLQEESAALKGSLNGMVALFAKLFADMPFAKREFAFGKLSADDLVELYRLLREVAHPLLGLGGIHDMFDRVSTMQAWDSLFTTDNNDNHPLTEDDANRQTKESFEEWRSIMRTLSGPFDRAADAMTEAVTHSLYRLELQKRPNVAQDEESKSDKPAPGDDDFAAYYETKLRQLWASKHDTLRTWCKEQGLDFPADTVDGPKPSLEDWMKKEQDLKRIPTRGERRRRELFLVLYMEHLFYSAAQAVLDLVKFADRKVADGTMKKQRFVAPGFKRLKKWGASIFSKDDDDGETNGQQKTSNEVFFGEAFSGTRRDPEHLAPQGFFEHIGNGIRWIPRMLRSEHTVFGFRAACATMTVAIIAYLKASQQFFIEQRLVWALIMVAFSMMRTSGHSVFNFISRILGTVIAMVASYVIWYIVDGKTAGVIVFLWLWMTACFYIVLKKPQFIIVAILSTVTSLLIVGYELQVDKIGVELSESNGQKAYPVYILAPYRLATVVGGLFVAYIWTIFPYPITEQSEIRRMTGSVLYASASYYSIVHEMFLTRLHCTGEYIGSRQDKGSPAWRIEKARVQLYARTNVLLQQLREATNFTQWEVTMGGRFPQEKYVEVINRVERIINCTSLIAYGSRSFLEQENLAPESQVWRRDFRRLIHSISPTSKEITSRLAILSSSLTSAQPLPPYIGKLAPMALVDRLARIDTDALSMRHLEEPGYSAFAVCQIAARTVVVDLNEVTELVRDLVGELDFSFNIIAKEARGPDYSSSDDSASSNPSSRDGKAGKGD